jgi:hypothetical protein
MFEREVSSTTSRPVRAFKARIYCLVLAGTFFKINGVLHGQVTRDFSERLEKR